MSRVDLVKLGEQLQGHCNSLTDVCGRLERAVPVGIRADEAIAIADLIDKAREWADATRDYIERPVDVRTHPDEFAAKCNRCDAADDALAALFEEGK